MRRSIGFGTIPVIVLLILAACASTAVKLGDCPLTVIVKSDASDFDGNAEIYVNDKFIGTTDSRSMQLKVNLKKGEYQIVVEAAGFQTWTSTILLLGKGYKQNVVATLNKEI